MFRPRTALTAFALLLTACSGPYEITFNDRVVYDPFAQPGEDEERLLADANLQACLNERLAQNPDLTPETLTLLSCSGTGVSTLEGIHLLPAMEQLELSDNLISDLTPLAQLDNLRALGIRNNRIRDIRPLRNLALLRFVSLTGNNGIPCSQLDDLANRSGSGLTRPASCR